VTDWIEENPCDQTNDFDQLIQFDDEKKARARRSPQTKAR
jgi:hypothetical protein